jgi:hypothetical protein
MSVGTGIQLIQLFLHPPLGTLQREHIAGMPSGEEQHFQRNRPQAYVDAMGIQYLIMSHPPGIGIADRPIGVRYDRTIMTIMIEHLLRDGGIVVSQEEDFRSASGLILFTESFPYFVHCRPAPGVVADYWWLLGLTTVPRSLGRGAEPLADAVNDGHGVDGAIVGRDGERVDETGP